MPTVATVSGCAQPTHLGLLAMWRAYFQQNRDYVWPLVKVGARSLTPEEKNAIARSIQKFQLGESSEGTQLMRLARWRAAQDGHADWVAVIKLLIGEEQRHARLLGQFMDQVGIPRQQQDWTDRAFRTLRRLANLEVALSVLMTAELIATVYYRALGQATGCAALRGLCRQIVWDEEHHVDFQAASLGLLDRGRSRHLSRFSRGLHGALFWMVTQLVWWDHRAVFRASGLGYRAYRRQLRAVWQRSRLTRQQVASADSAMLQH